MGVAAKTSRRAAQRRRKRILEFYAAGYSLTLVCSIMETTPEHVLKILREAGIEPVRYQGKGRSGDAPTKPREYRDHERLAPRFSPKVFLKWN